jgi:DNA-binding IclR family transcriptional regulator
MAKKPYYFVSSLARGIKILEILAEKGPATVTELATYLGVHRTASHRFLNTFRDLGYVVQDSSSRYKLSFRLFEQGMKTVHALKIEKMARPFMEELAEFSKETVNLGYLDGKEIVYIDKIITRNILRMEFALGCRVPAQGSAMGKSAMAFLPQIELQPIIKTISFKAYTSKTIITPAKLVEELERVRKNGFAIDDEESAMGVRCVAAPILDYKGPTRYAMSIAGPTSRMTNEKLPRFQKRIKLACTNLSREMGYKG